MSSNTIHVDHLGFTVWLDEDADLWRCDALRIESRSLAAVRSKINKHMADKRRLPNIKVMTFDSSMGAKVIEHECYLLDVDGIGIWTTRMERAHPRFGGVSRIEQRKGKISAKEALRDEPATRAALAELERLGAVTSAAREAEAAQRKMIQETMSHTLESLLALGLAKQETEQ